jgi:cysteine desulfuration protein SufE
MSDPSSLPPLFPSLEFHRNFLEIEDVKDLLALHTHEDRLIFLSERPPKVPLLPLEERTDTCKVPGCVSGLWIKGARKNGVWEFQTFSESSVVLGVSSLLCDLFYGATSEEVLSVTDKEIAALTIDQLLSLNRRHAVSKVIDFFRACAKNEA